MRKIEITTLKLNYIVCWKERRDHVFWYNQFSLKNGRGLLKVFVLKRELTVLQKLWSVWCCVMVSASFSGRLLDGVCIF